MRPVGDIRAAVQAALEVGPATLLDIVERGNLGYDAARYAVQNALRAGVIQVCGQEKRPHAKRWLAVYELCESAAAPDTEQLGGVMHSWVLVVQQEERVVFL